MNEVVSISQNEYVKIKNYVYDQFGIDLGENRQALVAGRLNKLLKHFGFSNFSEYYNYIKKDTSGEALDSLVNRISTNHTYFYRENIHFKFFENTLLKQLLNNSPNLDQIRVWSAGCSSGEEPYTLAILLLEFLKKQNIELECKVLATDISNNALEKSITGIYNNDNISKLPGNLRNKYFKKIDNHTWQVSEKIKNIVLFRRLNFMRQDFPFKKKFHCIFCRNVMIYFDPETRNELVSKFHRYMESNTYFFIGLSESLGRDNKYFKYIQPGIYQKVK